MRALYPYIFLCLFKMQTLKTKDQWISLQHSFSTTFTNCCTSVNKFLTIIIMTKVQ